VRFDLEGPASHFAQVAALWLAAPAPANGERPDLRAVTADIGNGPYRLESWEGDRLLRLAANEHYWSESAAHPLALVLGPGAVEAALTDLSTLRGDGLGDAESSGAPATVADIVAVPDTLAGAVLRDPRLAPLVVRQPRPATLWLSCNVGRKPLDDLQMRKALAYAIDREAYVARVLDGAAQPTYSLLPRGVLGHDPTAGAGYRLRPDVAQALLAAARVDPADVEALSVTVPATSQGHRAAAFLRDQLERHLGISIGVTELDRYAYLRALERRQYTLAFGGWESLYPDPEAWFWLVFGAEKAENRTGWQSAALDRLWRRADEVVDPERRLALYAAAQQVLLDEMPVIFLAQPERLAVVHPRLQGLAAGTMDEFPGLSSLPYVRVAP
jgi:oligopeptide transport system substrate-binding protein